MILRTFPLIDLSEEPYIIEYGEIQEIIESRGIFIREESISGPSNINLDRYNLYLGEKVNYNILNKISNDYNLNYEGSSGYIADSFDNLSVLDKKYIDENHIVDIYENNINSSIRTENGLRVVENHIWYVVLKLDGVYDFRLNQNIEIVSNQKNLEKSVDQFEISDDLNTYLLLKSSRNIKETINFRIEDIEIIYKTHKGLLIPLEYINKEYHYYTVNIIENDIKKTIPVNIIFKNEEYAIVSENNYLDDKDIRVNTVKLYDRIIKN